MQREQEEIAEQSRVRKTPSELKQELLSFLQPGENVAKALRRIGGKDGNTLCSSVV